MGFSASDQSDSALRPDDYDSEIPEEPRKRRWKFVLVLVVLVLIGAEVLASWAIARKLRTTVAQRLDADLKLGTLIYIPPYGAIVFGAELTRPNVKLPLLTMTRASIRLAELPWGKKPIIISSLRVQEPELIISPHAFEKMVRPREKDQPQRKLSDILRLTSLHLNDGQVTYRDGKHVGKPTIWDNLQIDVETDQQSVSSYAFHLLSRALPLADASAAGTIDVDSGMLEVRNLSMKVRAEPEPIKSPLPQGVQQVLKNYRISGDLTASASGTIPLKQPGSAKYSATMQLSDGMAQMPGLPLDHAVANLFCEKLPGGPTRVKIEKIDIAGGGKQMLITGGRIDLDASAGTWKVADVQGQLAIARPATLPAQTVTTVTFDDAPAKTPEQKFAKFERFEASGRADFSAAASGPFTLNGRDPWEAIEHEVVLYPRGASFRPKNFASRIEDIGGGEVRLTHGMIIFQELYGKYEADDLRLHAARLPVKGLPKLAQWQEISGSVIFRPPLRPYSPKLDKILNALGPQGPFIIAGAYTVNKTTPAAKNTYDLIISSDTGSFALGKERIPLSKIRGDATVSPAGVQLHGLEAELFGGRFTATGVWKRFNDGAQNTIDGDLTLRDADLTRLQQLRDEPSTRPLKGHVFGQATLSGSFAKDAPADDKIRGIKASGEMEIVNGNMYELPVLKEIFGAVGLKQAATVGDAAAVFDVADGQLVLRDAAVNAPALGLQGGGRISLTSEHGLDLNVVAAPLADWRDKLKETHIPIVSDVAGEVAGAIQKLLNTATGALLYEFRIGGTTRKVQVVAVPTPVLTDTGAFVFGKMIAPPKNQRPLDWFDREQPRAATK